jgi:hypothetical protein
MWHLKKIVSIIFLSLVSNFDILGRLCFKVKIKTIKKKRSLLDGRDSTVGGQIKLGHLKFNLCKSDH